MLLLKQNVSDSICIFKEKKLSIVHSFIVGNECNIKFMCVGKIVFFVNNVKVLGVYMQ